MERLLRLLPLAVLLAVGAPLAAGTEDGQEPPATQPTTRPTPPWLSLPKPPGSKFGAPRSAKDIARLLEEARGTLEDPIFKRGPFTPFGNVWDGMNDELEKAAGLRFGLSYTTLYQNASRGKDPRCAWSGDFDLFGSWKVPGPGDEPLGVLSFETEHRHRISSIPPAELGDQFGSLWATADGFGEHEYALRKLHWQQFLIKDVMALRLGKVDLSDFIDVYEFDSSNDAFLSPALNTNPTIPFPDFTLGFGVSTQLHELSYVTFGLADSNATKTTTGFGEFFCDNEYFKTLEFGFTPTIEGDKKGYYTIVFWHEDRRKKARTPEGKGLAITLEQELKGGWHPFFRYGYADGGSQVARQAISTGMGLAQPFGRRDDLVGAAFSWGQPRRRSHQDQYLFETFYRVAITPHMALTPDLQIIWDPSRARHHDTVYVLGLRMRIIF